MYWLHAAVGPTTWSTHWHCAAALPAPPGNAPGRRGRGTGHQRNALTSAGPVTAEQGSVNGAADRSGASPSKVVKLTRLFPEDQALAQLVCTLMSRQLHATIALVLASTAIGISFGSAMWIPFGNRACPHAHDHEPAAAPAPQPCGLAPTPPQITYTPPPATALEVELRDLIPATAGRELEIGELVLARWSDGNWWEARVEDLSRDMAQVAWLDGSPSMDLPRQHVAPLDGERPALQPGALAMCKWQTSTRWWRAKIHGEGNARAVLYIDGTSEPLAGQCVPAERGDVGFFE